MWIAFGILWAWAGLSIYIARKPVWDRKYDEGSKLIFLLLLILAWPVFPLLALVGD